MFKTPNHSNDQFSWPDILWRVAVTILILSLLTSFSLAAFNNGSPEPNAQVLPALTH